MLLTKTTATRSEAAIGYHRVRGYILWQLFF